MTIETQDRDSRRAGRREWIGLAVIALPCVLYSMDLTVLNLAVPHLSADLLSPRSGGPKYGGHSILLSQLSQTGPWMSHSGPSVMVHSGLH